MKINFEDLIVTISDDEIVNPLIQVSCEYEISTKNFGNFSFRSKLNFRLEDNQLEEVLQTGAKWCVKNNYGEQDDLEHCEENGSLEELAIPSKVSQPVLLIQEYAGSVSSIQ